MDGVIKASAEPDSLQTACSDYVLADTSVK